jgi:endonuclease YncB( thermonuclease family)
MRAFRIALVACLLIAWSAGWAGSAAAQTSSPATVTNVIDGRTVNARLADGREIVVRLIGIDVPSPPSECDASEATAALTTLVAGQAVSLVTDPYQPALDAEGRSLYYVDRSTDGVDAGQQMVESGLARIDPDEYFERLSRYRSGQRDARDFGDGVWSDCGGDFHRTRADEIRERKASAAEFMRDYYRAVSRRHFTRAWEMLGRRVRRKLGSFRQWKSGHRRSLGAAVTTTRVRLSGARAVVALSLRSRDRDACSGRVVTQRFRGRWVLMPRDHSWVAVNVHMRKTAGGRVRLSRAECPPPPRTSPPPPPPVESCTPGYNPCIAPGSDVDCAGGSGDGPRYVQGPVRVTGSDPYGLDNDGDGYGCES